MDYLTIVPAAALGFMTVNAATNPNSKVWRKLVRRSLRTKRVQVFPSFRINVAGRTIHFHHWLNFSLLLAFSFYLGSGFLSDLFTRGLLLGGILQGLSLPREHRSIVYRNHPNLPLLNE